MIVTDDIADTKPVKSNGVRPNDTADIYSRPQKWLALAAATTIAALYLFNLQTPFDFIDDGAISHDVAFTGLANWLRASLETVKSDYANRGTFLPTIWTFWRAEATLLGPQPVLWRAVWVRWCAASAFPMILLMLELKVALLPAFAATAFALWNSHRIEIWLNLASPEALAMPFALLALICAARASRNSRPTWLDAAGICCILLALGCKNTFIAVLPAQAFLRVVNANESVIEGLRKRGATGALLCTPAIWPIIHLYHLQTNWHPGQYTVPGPSFKGLFNAINGWRKSFITLATAHVWMTAGAAILNSRQFQFLRFYRNALIVSVLLIFAGLGVYLPMGTAAGGPGRDSIPAAWGADIILAVILSGGSTSTKVEIEDSLSRIHNDRINVRRCVCRRVTRSVPCASTAAYKHFR
jgi:hypothetical protein